MSINRANAKSFLALFLASALIMLFGTIFFSYLLWESYDSRRWPHVPGLVIASYSTRTCGGGTASSTWEAKIVYQYKVDGVAHEASRVGSGAALCDNDRREVEGWLKLHYPHGMAVDVYYNPANPDAAFLRPGEVEALDFVMVFANLALSLVMAWGVRMTLRVLARNG